MNIWEALDLRQVIPDSGARKDYSGYSVDRCPFHDDSRPSLIIYPRRWECKAGCGSGDVVEWVCRTRGVGRREAISFLRDGLPDQIEQKWTPKPKIVHKEELDQSLGLKYHLQLQEREREWYHWRGLTDQTIEQFELGFGAPPGGQTGRFTIPIYDENKHLANVKYRVDDRCPHCQSPWTFKGERSEGFLENEWYCADCKHRWVLDGSKFVGIKNHGEARLFGLETLKDAKRCFIVEGELDRAIMVQNDYVAVSSTGGCASFLLSWGMQFMRVPLIYVPFDNDAGGREGIEHVLEIVPHARGFPMPGGHKADITDFFKNHTKEDFEHLLQRTDTGKGMYMKVIGKCDGLRTG